MNAHIRFRRGLAVWVFSLAALTLASCLPVPLGDPEKAKIESSYVGAWEWRDGDKTNVVTIRPYDNRTYFVDAMTFGGTMDEPQPRARNLYKAWLTKVKGETFITMQPAETLGFFANEKPQPRYYLVSKLKLEEGQLKATGVNGGYLPLKDVPTPAALEQVITDHLNDPQMWTPMIVADPVRADRMDALAKLMKAFAEPKG